MALDSHEEPSNNNALAAVVNKTVVLLLHENHTKSKEIVCYCGTKPSPEMNAGVGSLTTNMTNDSTNSGDYTSKSEVASLGMSNHTPNMPSVDTFPSKVTTTVKEEGHLELDFCTDSSGKDATCKSATSVCEVGHKAE